MIDRLFFELMQVALGNRAALSKVPTEDEWASLFDMAQKQAVAGLAISAMDRLSQQGQKPPRLLLLQWIGIGDYIRNRNEFLDAKCIELETLFSEKKIKSSILKGQGVACYYGKELRALRQFGDIDIFVNCSREESIKLAEELQGKKVHWDYKHLQICLWDDVDIEMHYRVEVLFNLRKNRRLQKWFEKHEQWLYRESEGLIRPDVRFDLFYVLLHIYRHFLHEGVGLRQVVDYYFVLKAGVDYKEETVRALRDFEMLHFAQGLMWIMRAILGLEEKYLLCEPCEQEGRFILQQIMMGGNFGKYDARISHVGGRLGYVRQVIKHNVHLLRHYPADVVWAPIWIIWHKLWKITRK